MGIVFHVMCSPSYGSIGLFVWIAVGSILVTVKNHFPASHLLWVYLGWSWELSESWSRENQHKHLGYTGGGYLWSLERFLFGDVGGMGVSSTVADWSSLDWERRVQLKFLSLGLVERPWKPNWPLLDSLVSRNRWCNLALCLTWRG